MICAKLKNINTMTANEINTLILMAGCTGLEFARVVGVTEMTVNRWEQDQVRPAPEAMARMNELRELIVAMDVDEEERMVSSIIEGRIVEYLNKRLNRRDEKDAEKSRRK